MTFWRKSTSFEEFSNCRNRTSGLSTSSAKLELQSPSIKSSKLQRNGTALKFARSRTVCSKSLVPKSTRKKSEPLYIQAGGFPLHIWTGHFERFSKERCKFLSNCRIMI